MDGRACEGAKTVRVQGKGGEMGRALVGYPLGGGQGVCGLWASHHGSRIGEPARWRICTGAREGGGDGEGSDGLTLAECVATRQ